jgi:hypothetical protein
MQLPNLIVFELIRGDKFGDLLVEEGNVSLVLRTHAFLFVGKLSDVVLQVVNLSVAGFACVDVLVLQIFEGFIFLLNYSLQLLPSPFKLLSLEIYLAILLLHKTLQFVTFVLERVDQIIIVLAHSCNIDGMQTG